jgi:outer membrane protein assembly factor BamB
MRAISIVLLLPMLAGASDWPRFRGPDGAGVSSDRNLPAAIGRESGVAWKVAAPKGNSSPVVAGDRLFLTGHDGEERFIACYRTADGAQLWRRSIPKAHSEPPNPLNGPTTPTPAIGGESVFVFIPEFGLAAFSLDGKERWRAPLGPFGGVQGMASSPIYADGKVMLLIDTPEVAYLAAWDAETGKQAWKTDRPIGFLGSYATPSLYRPAKGATQVVVSGAVELAGYDVAGGKRLWWARGVTTAPATLPLVAGDAVYTMEPAGGAASPFANMLNQYDKNKDGKIQLSELEGEKVGEKIAHRLFKSIDKNSGNGDGEVTAAEWDKAFNPSQTSGGLVRTRLGGSGDVSATHIAWRYTKGLPYVISPLVYQGVLYVVRTGGIVSTFDPESGKLLREARLKDALGDYYAQPVAGDGKVYFISKDGKASVIRAGAEWEKIGAGDFDEQVIATPAIASGRLYVRTAANLYCFGQKAQP